MGINYDVVGVFGVEYSFNELENFMKNKDIVDLAEKIDCDFLPNLWEELGKGYISSRPYYDPDEHDFIYLLGYELSSSISSSNLREVLEREDEIKTMIREFSEKYNVKNKEDEIRFIYLPNVW